MAYNPTPDGTYEVSDDGGANWHRILNVTDFTFSGGDRESEETQTLDEGSIVSVGPAQTKDVNVGVNASVGSKGYNVLHDAYTGGDRVTIRIKTKMQTITDNAVAADTLAIAADGTVTAAGAIDFQTDTKWVKGRAIVMANKTYIIESVTDATHLKVLPKPAAPVAASQNWKLVNYGLQYQFEADVISAGNVSLQPGAALADTFTLKTAGLAVVPTLLVN